MGCALLKIQDQFLVRVSAHRAGGAADLRHHRDGHRRTCDAAGTGGTAGDPHCAGRAFFLSAKVAMTKTGKIRKSGLPGVGVYFSGEMPY